MKKITLDGNETFIWTMWVQQGYFSSVKLHVLNSRNMGVVAEFEYFRR